MRIELGKKVKDKVSGLEGIAISRTQFLNGCIRITIQAPVDKDGNLPDEKWFDEDQCEETGEGIVSSMPQKTATTGGPGSNSPPSMQR